MEASVAPSSGGKQLLPMRAQVDAEAYEELLQENLELRKKVAEVTVSKETVAQENERLAREINDLEGRIAEFASLIQQLQAEREAVPVNTEEITTLEAQLQRAQDEQGRLNNALQEAQRQLTVLQSKPAEDPRTKVQPGSPLFKELEEENALLREKLTELERLRMQATQAEDALAEREAEWARIRESTEETKDALAAELEVAKQSEQRHRQLMEKILNKMPKLEQEVTELRAEVQQKDRALTDRERLLTALQQELKRREHRVVKAERVAGMIEQARDDVEAVDAREKRDMHYNMAMVFAKEGRFKDAEREYLHALRIDPGDAGVHYNLGILYDDELEDKRRAASHYRKYLQLAPHSEDVDKVRHWLNLIEVQR